MRVIIVLIALWGCGQQPVGHTQSPQAISMLIADSTRQFQGARTVLSQHILNIRELLDAIEKMKLTKDRNRLKRIRDFFSFDVNSAGKLTSEDDAQVKHLLGSVKRWQALELELTQVDSTVSGVLAELHKTKLEVDERMFLLADRSGRSIDSYDKDALLKVEEDAIEQLINEGKLNVGELVKSLGEGMEAIETVTRVVEEKLSKLQ